MAWTRVAALAELKERGVMDTELNGDEIALYWVDDAPYATSRFGRRSSGLRGGNRLRNAHNRPQHGARSNHDSSPLTRILRQ